MSQPTRRTAGSENTDYVLLVKPQFEVGRKDVARGGVVRDPSLHLAALRSAVLGLHEGGIGARDATPSPVTGAKGNREFLVWCRIGPASLRDEDLASLVEMP